MAYRMSSAGVASTATSTVSSSGAPIATDNNSEEYASGLITNQSSVTSNVAPSFVFDCDPSSEGQSISSASRIEPSSFTSTKELSIVGGHNPSTDSLLHNDNLSIMYHKNSNNNPLVFGRMHSEPERPLPLIEFASLEPPVELQTLNPNHRSCPEISPERAKLEASPNHLSW